MIILGIDPGTAAMGWGVVEKQATSSKTQKAKIKHVGHGMIATSSEDDIGTRLLFLREGITDLIKEYIVDEVAAEKIFFNINKKTAICVSQALGVVHLAAAEKKLSVYEYNALEAKRRITGDGRADKRLIQQEVQKMLRLEKHPTPVHAADALAIALCHIMHCENKDG